MIQSKGILAKLVERGVRILLTKECKKIAHLKIDLNASSIQIIKGEIQRINITAKDVNYKELFLDEVELKANQIKINFNLTKKQLKFKDNPRLEFKISLSANSLNKVLLSKNWNWIKNMINKELLNHKRLENLKISDGRLLIKALENSISINELLHINVKTDNGKFFLVNKKYNKIIQIPLEDKIYIEDVNLDNNLINISARSTISF